MEVYSAVAKEGKKQNNFSPHMTSTQTLSTLEFCMPRGVPVGNGIFCWRMKVFNLMYPNNLGAESRTNTFGKNWKYAHKKACFKVKRFKGGHLENLAMTCFWEMQCLIHLHPFNM